MNIDFNTLYQHRQLLTRIAEASSSEDLQDQLHSLSEEQRNIVENLLNSDEMAWREFLSELKSADTEFASTAETARTLLLSSMSSSVSQESPFASSSRIQQVFFAPYLGLASQNAIIRLYLKTFDNKTLVSDQDLEDTLGVGAVIVESVADTVNSMIGRLGVSPDVVSWGSEFESRLLRAEQAVQALRKHYEQRQTPSGDS